MNKNPFSIRKSPAEIIATQAATLDDYLKLNPFVPIVAMARNPFLTPVLQLNKDK
jgi:ABC-type polysaccharide/polyol phosphate export permease